QALRQQRDLRPSLTFNKSLHDRPRYDLDDQKIRQLREFSHSLDPKRSYDFRGSGRSKWMLPHIGHANTTSASL
ncbi:MAG TPA: hypothetical protein K8W20_10455, partial [Pseudomonas lactis]